MAKAAMRLMAAALALSTALSPPAMAWGDEGHEIVARIAEAYLEPTVRKKVKALLAADPDTLTAHKITDAATWADRYRDANVNDARQATRQWHFVDIEIAAPDLDRACFGHPRSPQGGLASNGPAQACVVDKIQEFAAELGNPATPPAEQIVALKFLLHFVGDLHQPLHAADDHDRGGNDKRVSSDRYDAGNLHHYWDTEFVETLGASPSRVALGLARRISEADWRAWSQGTPSDWAMDSFRLAKDHVYGQLPPPNARGGYRLSESYVAMAVQDVATQLSKAGVRLAVLLNRALGQNR